MRFVELTTKRVKIPKGLNTHAIMAWCYVGEVATTCRDAIHNYEFTCLIRDLYDAYPDEYEFYIDITNRG